MSMYALWPTIFGSCLLIDILFRVNAEESRAVGVSGLQSNHRLQILSSTGSPTTSDWWTAGSIKPRYPYPRPCLTTRCCFYHRDASRRQRTLGYQVACFEQSTHPSRMWCPPAALPDGRPVT